jgi:hypothetical protein
MTGACAILTDNDSNNNEAHDLQTKTPKASDDYRTHDC